MVIYADLGLLLVSPVVAGTSNGSLKIHASIAVNLTCFEVEDLFGCLIRWTKSGGPSSRSVWRESVRISMTECVSSSNNLHCYSAPQLHMQLASRNLLTPALQWPPYSPVIKSLSFFSVAAVVIGGLEGEFKRIGGERGAN